MTADRLTVLTSVNRRLASKTFSQKKDGTIQNRSYGNEKYFSVTARSGIRANRAPASLPACATGDSPTPGGSCSPPLQKPLRFLEPASRSSTSRSTSALHSFARDAAVKIPQGFWQIQCDPDVCRHAGVALIQVSSPPYGHETTRLRARLCIAARRL